MNTIDELTPEENQLFEKVPTDGSNAGNISLRRMLGWDESKYWPVRDSLYAKGKIGLVRCRGGAIRRISTVTIQPQPPQPAPAPGAPSEKPKVESDHYADLEQALREQWARSMGFENFLVQVTAQQGRRDTGGAWTRPDLIVVNVSNYRYVPGRQLDLISFEVKLVVEADVKAVYEALAHTRAAKSAYLVLIGEGVCPQEELDEIKTEAAKHGVGLIAIKEATKFDDWVFLLEPRSTMPDAASLEEFIETQLTDENKRKVSLWVK